jgi:hypothetical protein
MMSIPSFSNIINSNVKKLFNNAIGALLEDGALTVPCTLYFGVTKYEACSNCVYDPIGRKSSNRFLSGGPVPFRSGGVCPVCSGDGKKAVITTEDIYLAVIYDYKDFLGIRTPVNVPEGIIQTISKKSTTPKLIRAKEIQPSTDLSNYSDARFERASEPQPIGLGNDEFVFCNWKRIK